MTNNSINDYLITAFAIACSCLVVFAIVAATCGL